MAHSHQHSLVRRFARLSVLNILSNITTPLASLADIAFLGHLDQAWSLAGVALASVVFDYLFWSFGFLRMGTTGLTAQALGRGDRTEAIAIGLRNGAIAVVAGGAIMLLQVPLRQIGFALLHGDAAVQWQGQAYFAARIWGSLPTLLNFVLTGWLFGLERSGLVLAMTVAANLSNVGLNYVLVVRWGMEAAGAGWATAFSQYIMVLVGLAGAWPLVRLAPWSTVLPSICDGVALRHSVSLNGNIFVRTFALVTAFALFTNISSMLGASVLATNALLLQVVTLAAYCIDGMAFATESLAGTFMGEGSPAQLKRLLQVSAGGSIVTGLGFAVAFWAFPSHLFGLLTDRPNLLAGVTRYVVWLLPVLGTGAIAYLLDGYFLGLAEGRILRWSTVWATGLGFLPMALIALYSRNPHLLWLALVLFMTVRAVSLGVKVAQTFEE